MRLCAGVWSGAVVVVVIEESVRGGRGLGVTVATVFHGDIDDERIVVVVSAPFRVTV